MNTIVNSSVFTSPDQFSNPCLNVTTFAFDSHYHCYTQHGFCDTVLNNDKCTNLCEAFEVAEIKELGYAAYGRQSRKQVSTFAMFLTGFFIPLSGFTRHCIHITYEYPVTFGRVYALIDACYWVSYNIYVIQVWKCAKDCDLHEIVGGKDLCSGQCFTKSSAGRVKDLFTSVKGYLASK